MQSTWWNFLKIFPHITKLGYYNILGCMCQNMIFSKKLVLALEMAFLKHFWWEHIQRTLGAKESTPSLEGRPKTLEIKFIDEFQRFVRSRESVSTHKLENYIAFISLMNMYATIVRILKISKFHISIVTTSVVKSIGSHSLQ